MVTKYKIDPIPCKFESHFSDSVPMPFGSGNCSMPGFECLYDGDNYEAVDNHEVCELVCPGYTQEEIATCEKHGEYVKKGGCEECMWGDQPEY